MSGQVITIPKQKDKAIIDCFKSIAETLVHHTPSASLSLLGSHNIQFDPCNSDQNEEIKALLKKNSSLIYAASFSAAGYSVHVYKGGRQEPKSAYTDEVVINANGNNCQLSTSEKLDASHIITKQFKALEPNRTVGNKQTKEQEELAAIHESTLSRLEELNEALISETHSYRKELDTEFRERQGSLEASYEEKEKEQQKHLEQKLSELHHREQEFETRKKDLDDKSNTHARRQIRKDIIGEIKQRQSEFKLTAGTNKLRHPIAIAMLVLIAVFVSLTAVSIWDFYYAMGSKDTQNLWLTGGKQLIYSFGAVGSILFYIRWQNRWFEQHSLAEFHLKQLELDMERASWIVETSLEWNDVKGDTIPPELLDSLSRNLFKEQNDTTESLVHPADQLASALLGSASTVRLKAGDAELEIDPKKLKKAKTESPPKP